ncbi:GNAT family N-acetyltransferase [Streptomyces sp. NPDC005202]|uniref:GNAT family N-acetyltransferase n=1 Tax=Streptomyces sp. NPDC005202 TaxID=3157021 RepID=UPI0033B65FA0
MWAAQVRADGRPGPGVRVFQHGSATAVASPALSGRDRIAVAGETQDALPLVREVLRQVGPTYRPFGDARLIDALVRGIDGLEPGARSFCWMETVTPPEPPAAVDWLDERGEKEARALFDLYFPDSYAQPGRAGVRRWAGAYEAEGGRLLAVAADAWSGAGCGFMAGVVTHPRARGRGLGAAVSRFVVNALVRQVRTGRPDGGLPQRARGRGVRAGRDAQTSVRGGGGGPMIWVAGPPADDSLPCPRRQGATPCRVMRRPPPSRRSTRRASPGRCWN